MKTWLRTDTIWFGLLIGLIVAAVTYTFFWLVLGSIPVTKVLVSDPRTLSLIAFIPNLLLMRLYFVNFKCEKTGQGILMLTFAGIVFVFFLFK
ncbi:MAG: hypothetical protein Q8S18_07905 [Bacteroidales bacterium]|nr:hypothetical protein [Bacteroidales bacterium]